MYTHEYKLEIGDTTFKGDLEVTNAGLVAIKETSNDLMSERIRDTINSVLSKLCVLPASYNELKSFKLSIKEEE